MGKAVQVAVRAKSLRVQSNDGKPYFLVLTSFEIFTCVFLKQLKRGLKRTKSRNRLQLELSWLAACVNCKQNLILLIFCRYLRQ